MKSVKPKKEVATKKSFFDQLTAKDRFFKRPDGWVRDNLLGLDFGPTSETRMTVRFAPASD